MKSFLSVLALSLLATVNGQAAESQIDVNQYRGLPNYTNDAPMIAMQGAGKTFHVSVLDTCRDGEVLKTVEAKTYCAEKKVTRLNSYQTETVCLRTDTVRPEANVVQVKRSCASAPYNPNQSYCPYPNEWTVELPMTYKVTVFHHLRGVGYPYGLPDEYKRAIGSMVFTIPACSN